MTGVAVIIPCFNLGRTVEEAVASVRQQHQPAAELVVVDDGSDDAYTQQALSRVRRLGVRVITTPNRGVASARNLGVSLTSAPYIAFLDADDVFEPAYIERLSAVLDERSDVDFVTCALQAFGEADYVWTPPACTWLKTLTRGGPHISSMLRRRLWRSVGGFDSSLEGYEDSDFWLSALERQHQGIVIPEALLRYRVRSGSRYQQAIMGPRYVATMAALYRKHPPRTAVEGREVLLDKEAFLADQHTYRQQVLQRRADLEQQLTVLNDTIVAVTARVGEAGLQSPDWGDLRQLTPISPVWGLDRGRPLDREYIEAFIYRHRADIQGRVLEVKDAGYTRHFGGAQVTAAEVIDVDTDNPNATIIGDLAKPMDVPENRFDCFLFTQTLHIIYDTRAVIASIYRLLKPGGVLLCTVPCVSRVSFEDGGINEGDFWRFTPAAMRAVFAEVFPVDAFEVVSYGNVMTCAAFLHGLAPHEVGRAVLDAHDPGFPLVCSIRAVKPLPDVPPLHVPERPSNGRVTATDPGDTGLVLLYHRVGRRTPDTHDMCVDTSDFADQMRHLCSQFCPLPLEELVERTLNGTAPKGAVAVTLDDGYLENLEVVSPILRGLNMPATFFVNTDRLEDEHECWWDVLERVLISDDDVPPVLDLFGDGRWIRPTDTPEERKLAHRGVMEAIYAASAHDREAVIDRLVAWSGRQWVPRRSHRPMTSGEVVELAGQPGHEIGAHTVHHLCLAHQPASVQLAEIVECKATLERLLRRRVTALAYPYGHFDGRFVAAARESGLETAVSVDGRLLRSTTHRMMVPRLEIKQCGIADFARLLEGTFAER